MVDSNSNGEGQDQGRGSEKVGREEEEQLLNYSNDASTMEQIRELAEQLSNAKEAKRQYDGLVKMQKEIIDDLSETIISCMTTLGMKSVDFKGVGKFSIITEAYASYTKSMEDDVFEIINTLGHGDMIRPYVAPATFKRWFKEEAARRVEMGEQPLHELFGGMVRVFDKISIRMRK